MPRTALRRSVRGLSPAWFSAVMGTGIIAVVGARLTLPGAAGLSRGAGALAAALLVLLVVGSVLRWRWFPRTAVEETHDPATRAFAGAPPIAVLTTSSVVGALAPGWTVLQVVLWTVGTVLGVVVTLTIPLSLLRDPDARPDPAWLLSVAPALVAGSTGATLVGKAPAGEPRLVLLGLCTALAGAALLLALVVTVLVVGRSEREGGPHGDAEPPVWVVLGALAQGVVASVLLGAQAEQVLAGRGIGGAALLLATALWGAGVLVGVIVVGLTVRELRDGLAFGRSWWSFTFPLGSAVLATLVLAEDVGSVTLRVLGTGLFAVQLLVWAAVAGATVRAVRRGAEPEAADG